MMMQAKCPIYVRKSVWNEHATPIERRPPEGKAAVASIAEDPTGTSALTSIRCCQISGPGDTRCLQM